MKKTLALVLSLLLVMCSFSAFAKVGQVDTDYSAMEKYTINWTQYYVTPAADDAVTIKLIEDTFNVDVNILPIEDSTFMEVLNAYILRGETPDVMRLKDPASFTTYVDQEAVGAINMELVKEHFPIYYDSLSTYAGGQFLTYGSIDGVQYGLPAIATGNVYHLPVVYNETWMNNVGVTETPTTLDELHDLLYKFTFEDPDQNGIDDTYGISSDAMRLVFGAYGVNPGAADGRTDHSAFLYLDDDNDGEKEFVYCATSQRYQEALEVLNAWYNEGIIDPEFVTGENTGGYWAISHSMVNHRIGCTVRGNYYHWVTAGDFKNTDVDGSKIDCENGTVATEFYNANPNEKLTYGDPVVGPYGDSGVKSWNMLSQIWAFSPELVKDEGKFTRVLDIMNFMTRNSSYDPEVMEDFLEDVYGEEGTYWYWVDKETRQWLTTELFRTDYPEMDPVNRFGRSEYGPASALPEVSAQTVFAQSLGYSEHGISTLIQFSLPLMAQYQTNITNLKDNWMVQFIQGAKNIETDWQEYLDDMAANGLTDMYNEALAYFEASN